MSFGDESQSASQYLSSSHSSLNASKKASSEISKIYRHASQLYLTRRLAEAYEVLQSVIEPPAPQQNGHAEHDEGPILAPIATASTSQRIKTWSLYAALLNAAIDLGSEEGAREFGQQRYRKLLKLVQNGDVWEQVVQDGYRGREDSVDAEVVYNISTLLLGKAQDQTVNQSRLETYLSSSPQSNLDLSTHVTQSLRNGHRTPMNGASTPKDLSSRVKIIELFTLHVLPANNEWDYARSFVTNSDILDDERREAFLQTLTELQEAKEQELALEDNTDYSEDDSPEPEPEPESRATQPSPASRGHHRTSSEVDYGIDHERPNGLQSSSSAQTQTQHAKLPQPTSNPPKQMTSLPPKPEPTPSTTKPQPSHSQPPRRQSGAPARRSKNPQNSAGLASQARHLLKAVSNLTRNLGGALLGNSGAVLRVLLFLVAFFMAFSRPEVRERVRAVVGRGWEKMRRTVGMGVKVSYI
jgi:hypothetical protein